MKSIPERWLRPARGHIGNGLPRLGGGPGPPAPPAVGQQIPCGEDPHGKEGHQGHQVGAAGEHLNGVLQHPMDLENGLQQGQGQQLGLPLYLPAADSAR